ncbi:hypothetical protein PTKIN_Ptkin16aG0108400 [Pterospermum kingtungense]
MKKKAGVCSTIPVDIERDILARLPVKSLLRFKCVQKSWRNLIENPTFITKHMDLFSKNYDGFLLYLSSRNQFIKQYYRRGNENSNVVGSSERNEIFKSSAKCSLGRCIIGSSNGLVCLSNKLIVWDGLESPLRIYILNPSTRKILEVPRYDCKGVEAEFSLSSVFGFGFCPILNDYKVIKLISYDSSWPLELQVYSLSTNSWKKIAVRNRWVPFIPSFGRKLFINGASYWLVRKSTPPRRVLILAFKFDEEVSLEINVPNHPDFNQRFPNLLVTEYQNLLSLVSNGSDNGDEFDVWVKNDNGVDDSWVKQFTILLPIPQHNKLVLLSFENNGEFLVVRDKKQGKIVLYNSKINQIDEKELLVPLLDFVCCKESLVSLPGESSVELLQE